MANVMFKRGTLAQFQNISSFVDGTIYITTDEGGIYLGTATGAKRLGDYWEVDSVSALNALPNKATGCLYYVKDVNVLARWDETNKRFIQINAAGILNVEYDQNKSSGNVITNFRIETNADNSRKLVFEKDITVAESANLTALQGEVDALEQVVSNMDAAYKKADSDMQSALLGGGTLNTHTIKGAYDAAAEALEAGNSGIAKGDAAQQTANQAVASIQALTQTVNNNETDIEKKVSDMDAAYKAADTAVKEVIWGDTAATGTYKTINALSGKLETVDATATDAQTRVGTAESAITAHAARLTELERITDLPTVGGQEQTVTAYVAEQVAAAKKEILLGDATEEINSAYDTILEIAKYIEEDTAGGASVASQVATNAADIVTLKGDIEDLEDKDAALTTAIETEATNRANADIALRKQILGEDGETSSATYKTIKDLSAQVALNKTTADTATADITTIKGQITGLTAEDGRLAGLINGLDTAYKAADEALEARLVSGTPTGATGDYKNINTLSTHIKDAEGNITALEGRATAVEARASALEGLLTWGSFTNN